MFRGLFYLLARAAWGTLPGAVLGRDISTMGIDPFPACPLSLTEQSLPLQMEEPQVPSGCTSTETLLRALWAAVESHRSLATFCWVTHTLSDIAEINYGVSLHFMSCSILGVSWGRRLNGWRVSAGAPEVSCKARLP